jgi:regulator of sirC expression with transglutaminase-like and TPR domain
MRSRVPTLLTALVMATCLIGGCQTVTKKTQLTIQEAKGTLTLRNSATVLKGLEARSLDEVLRLPDDEIDLATAILLISQEAHKDLDNIDIDVHRYRHRVDEMASALLSRIGKEKSPEAIIRVMNHYVSEELNFSFFGEADDPKPSFLTFVLDEKKGNCFGLSILYLSIAERIGLSLFGVTAPGHAFVRYEDNIKRINIETTAKGQNNPDSYYIDTFNIPRGSEFYLKSLGKKEMIGVFLTNVGNAYSSKGQYDQAISDYNKALEINPRCAEAYTSRGTAYYNKGLWGDLYMMKLSDKKNGCSDWKRACELGLCQNYELAKRKRVCE